MNVPNLITVFRLLLTLVFIFLISQESLAAQACALSVFTLAAFSDFYDGYYARKHGQISAFGKMMDPIADKFLILSAFFIAMHMRIIFVWMFAVIFVREVLITGLRLWVMRSGETLAAEAAGKVKTVLQIIAIYLIILFIMAAHLTTDAAWQREIILWMSRLINVMMLAVVFVTVWSGISFLRNNRRVIFHVR